MRALSFAVVAVLLAQAANAAPRSRSPKGSGTANTGRRAVTAVAVSTRNAPSDGREAGAPAGDEITFDKQSSVPVGGAGVQRESGPGPSRASANSGGSRGSGGGGGSSGGGSGGGSASTTKAAAPPPPKVGFSQVAQAAQAAVQAPSAHSSGGGSASAYESFAEAPPPPPPPSAGLCDVPNVTGILNEVRGRPGMNAALHRLCRHNTDWTFLDAAIDTLRRSDRRWGYFCRRGNCGDLSHDVIAYYCGDGNPSEGSPNASGVDVIVSACYDVPEDGDPSIGWSGNFSNGGQPVWGTRGRF